LSEGTAFIGCRPEHLEVRDSGQGHTDATVTVKEQLGGETLLYFKTESGQVIVAKVSGEDSTQVGQTVGIHVPKDRLHQFNSDGRAV